LFLPTGPVLAQASAVPEAAFTGTIVSTYPDGRQARLWLERDGTFRGQGRSGKRNSGRWRLAGKRICLRQVRPAPVPFSYCAPVPEGEIGTRWGGKAVTGEPISLEVVSGR
jgi:hypothetical protein